MKKLIVLFFIATGFLSIAQQRDYLLLKQYSFSNIQELEQTSKFIEKSYFPALKELGYDNIGVFIENPQEPDMVPDLYLLITLSEINTIADLDQKLLNLGVWNGPMLPNFTHVNTTLMRTFKDMPSLKPSPLKGDRSKRVYELRSYESTNEERYLNKVDMFNAGGEITLFDELGFNAVFYGEVIAGSRMPNLIYMTTFESRETRDKLWEKFFSSAKWESLKSDPFYQGNVSKADIIFMKPTEYSDY